MTSEKFQIFCEQIEKRFKLMDEGADVLENPSGKIMWKIYQLPEKLIKLTLRATAKFEKEKIQTAKRIGAQAHIERVYSDTETVNTLIIEKKETGSDEWEKINPEEFLISDS